jgi:tRNA threonylcarbamoyladenosine biosynthesis protein TsaB
VLAVALDTTSDIAGVALIEDGALLGETTWRSRQNHSRQLLPSLDWLLQRSNRSKTDLGAIIVCLGPGSYAGMRVGVSTAKALAFGFDIPLGGVGRLAADAYPVALAAGGRVLPVQAAGRAELAWAMYKAQDQRLIELEGPRLSPEKDLLRAISSGDVLCSDAGFSDDFRAAVELAGARLVAAHPSRVVAVAQLGWRRIVTGDFDAPEMVVPLYLRAPAIGPQPPR